VGVDRGHGDFDNEDGVTISLEVKSKVIAIGDGISTIAAHKPQRCRQ
jgi:hypothetical protein